MGPLARLKLERPEAILIKSSVSDNAGSGPQCDLLETYTRKISEWTTLCYY